MMLQQLQLLSLLTLQVLLILTVNLTHAWVPTLSSASVSVSKRSFTTLYSSTAARKPSLVSDPDGPTPAVADQDDMEEVDPQDVPELREIMDSDELPRPIPHQPWRLGNMDGCEDPLDAEWRLAAEQLIYTAVKLVGGQVVDITWFLTQLIVTLDEDLTVEQRDFFRSSGPVINVDTPEDPLYHDPLDPKPADILDPGATMYQRQTEEEQDDAKARTDKRWANKDEDDDPDEPHNPLAQADAQSQLYRNEEGRPDIAYYAAKEEAVRATEGEHIVDSNSLPVDTMVLSTIAGAIVEALKEVEDEINVLSRHELILVSPGAPDVVETQKQFNLHRGQHVIVETQDPFESNRVLKGTLVDRNTMDVMINQKGRLVTIPQCFVKCVRIPNYFQKLAAERGEEVDESLVDEMQDDEDEELEEYTGPMP